MATQPDDGQREQERHGERGEGIAGELIDLPPQADSGQRQDHPNDIQASLYQGPPGQTKPGFSEARDQKQKRECRTTEGILSQL